MNRFVIPARLPGLNEVIEANRSGWRVGAALKKDTETLIRLAIRAAKGRGECWPVSGPCAVLFEWQETNRLRDLDNIFSGKKFILDAMRAEGLIRNDSQRYVRALSDVFDTGDTDRVTVIIELLEGKDNDKSLE